MTSRLSGSARIWLLVAAIATAAATLYLFGVRGGQAPVHSTYLPWYVLAGLFYLAEAFVIHLHFRREAHTLSLNEFGLVLGLIFVSPERLILAQLLGGFAALFLHRRQRPI